MRGVLLLSGGIDSPVAGLMMLERGMDLVLLHMDNRPFTDDRQLEKVRSLAGALSKAAGRKLPLIVAPHGKAQAAIAKACDRHVHCIICRRTMLRLAERVSRAEGAMFVITGESLGQVASQTLSNIRVEDGATSLPVLRPLIGLDKQEIVERARALGTFELSIAPGLCCTIVPDKPSTSSTVERIRREEALIDVEALVSSLFEGAVRE